MLTAVAPERQAGPGARGMKAAAEATAAENAAARSMAAADARRGAVNPKMTPPLQRVGKVTPSNSLNTVI